MRTIKAISLAAGCAIAAIFIPLENIHAAGVVCQFKWNVNPAKNVKAGSQIFRNLHAPKWAYNKLVDIKTRKVKVSGDLGSKCTLKHPKDFIVHIFVNKKDWRLDSQKRIPNCVEFRAVVKCVGKVMAARHFQKNRPDHLDNQ